MTTEPRDELAEFYDDFDLDGPAQVSFAPKGETDPRCGFFPGIDPLAYHADPIEEGSLSNSGIKILLDETPLDFAFQYPRINPEAREKVIETVAGMRGDLVHQLALGKGRGYAIFDSDAWRTKEAKAFKKAAIEDGKTPVLKHAFEEAEVMAEVIVERVKRILDGASYETEVAIIWREETPEGSIYMRGLLDIWCAELGIILDPKITAQLGDGRPGQEKIARHAVSMGWDMQAGLYCRGVERLMPELENRVRFGNLMVKPEEPFTSRLLYPDVVARRTALYQARPAMATFARCQRLGDWPGYPEEGEPLRLPEWEENRRLESEINAHG